MYLIITKVRLKPGSIDACANLFQTTNPALVKTEPDWLHAKMVADRETNTITVLASWTHASSYKALSSSPTFKAVMEQFSEFFAAPPDITINELLVDMTKDSVTADDTGAL